MQVTFFIALPVLTPGAALADPDDRELTEILHPSEGHAKANERVVNASLIR